MKKAWFKIVGSILILLTTYGGLMFEVPRKVILNESIRNLYFHVPMWFGMIFLLGISAFFAIKHLQTNNFEYDLKAEAAAKAGLIFGILGMITGMLWAQFTWGEWWSGDPKQNGSAIALLIYFAFFILRGSFTDDQKRAKVSAVYNIFAFATLIPLLFILPRLTDSLHPGNGGNPGFGAYDLDNRMRVIFYPAVIGWIFIGIWISELQFRIARLENNYNESTINE